MATRPTFMTIAMSCKYKLSSRVDLKDSHFIVKVPVRQQGRWGEVVDDASVETRRFSLAVVHGRAQGWALCAAF